MTISTGAMDIPKQVPDAIEDSSFRPGESPCEIPSSYADLGHANLLAEHGASGLSLNDAQTLREAEEGEEAQRLVETVPLLPGEKTVEFEIFLSCVLLLTNFRVCVISIDGRGCAVVALAALDTVDAKDLLQLILTCKEGRVFRLTALSSESACHWYKRLTQLIYRERTSDCFAYEFGKAAKDLKKDRGSSVRWLQGGLMDEEVEARCDFQRLGFSDAKFRVSDANKAFEVCETYPRTIIVPKDITDDQLKKGRDFRFLGRFPAVVWRCKETKAVLLRSSQPRTSLFSWRSQEDERILSLVRESMGDDSAYQLTILDARSYGAAWANRAKGGGFESAEYYKNTDIQFLGLPNIHHVRYSFHQLRALLTAPADQSSYLQQLQATNWFLYLSNLLGAANRCVDLLMDNGQSVLVHCSDGWDRTTQIVSFAKLIADPYYRTMKGFEALIRSEWVSFGHKFADRNGIAGTDGNERAPVFLQFLDGVHQLVKQHSTAFEFNMNYLVKLAQHTYSGLFGTFLHNSLKDAQNASADRDRTVSVWKFLHKDREEVVNQTYDERKYTGRLQLDIGVQSTHLWKEVYCCGNTERVINTPEERQTMQCLLARDMEKSLVRSSSSDSLSRVGEGMATPIIGSVLHGSNTRLNEQPSIDFLDGVQSQTDSLTATTNRLTQKARAGESSKLGIKILQDLLDLDGLVLFRDPEQERMRQIKASQQAAVEGLRGEIAKLRQRSKSERTDTSSLGGKTSLRSFNGEDVMESEDSLDRLSILDDADTLSAFRATQGWEVSANKCSVCLAQFGPINREHHCRACLKKVCDRCSLNRFHHAVNGKGEQARACDNCYNKWTPQLAENEEEESISPLRAAPAQSQPIPVPFPSVAASNGDNSGCVDPLHTHRGSTGSLTSQSSYHTGQAVQG